MGHQRVAGVWENGSICGGSLIVHGRVRERGQDGNDNRDEVAQGERNDDAIVQAEPGDVETACGC